MSIQEKIDQDIKQSMIAKDADKLGALRMLKSAIKYAALEKKGSAFSDADVMQVKKSGGGLSTRALVIIGAVAVAAVVIGIIVKPALCDGGAAC